MPLEEKVMAQMKDAMKAKDEKNLRSLRAIKAAIILAKTAEGAGGRLKEEDEELLIELERRYASKLMFRGDPTFHHEKFVITDANNGAELKA